MTTALTTGSMKDFGISVADALSVMRVALFVAALAAVVTGILGIFVLQRHATARIVLTVAAIPVVLTAPFSGGFLAMIIGGCTALLWSRPARDWFAGRAPTRPERPVGRVARAETAVTRVLRRPAPPTSTASQPPPTSGWGQPRPPVPFGAHPSVPAYAAPAAGPVPRQVRIACVLTWVLSLLTAFIYLLVALALLVARTRTLDLLRDNPAVRDRSIGDDELVAIVLAVSAGIVVWCLVACGLAYFVQRRQAWAWVLLVVSVGAATAVEVVSLPYSVLHLAASGTALRLLLVAPTRAWFRGDGAGPPGALPPEALPPEAQGWAPPDPRSQQPAPPAEQPQGKPPVW